MDVKNFKMMMIPKTVLCLCVLLGAFMSQAMAGVYETTGHGNPQTGAMRDNAIPRGSCNQCHVEGSKDLKYQKSLWRENDNGLCYACHREMNFSGIYPGLEVYETSNHRTDPRFVWPGPFPPGRREMGAQGKCLNCHNPHGRKDRYGVVPSHLVAREEELCLACHDGSPAARDIARELRKPYSHPTRQGSDRHSAGEGGNPARYSYLGGNRHAECSDCHNPHAAFSDPRTPVAPLASSRNSKVSRLRVMNGPPDSIPLYQYSPASDTSTPVLEYEICYKCHSSWTQQPPGQKDIARLFNTNNASFHPVEGQGRNPGINPSSFVAGMNAFTTIHCSDCHGSEDSNLRGPHGSQFPKILRRAYEARSTSRMTTRDELCFLCHNFDTYADPASSPIAQQASRFNPPASLSGHVFHVGQRNSPCYACHDSHGSPQFGALIVTGRNPGLRSFSMNSSGGSCAPSCHVARAYVINYTR